MFSRTSVISHLDNHEHHYDLTLFFNEIGVFSLKFTSIVRQFDNSTYFSFPNECRITKVPLYFKNQVQMNICSKKN